MTVDRVVDLRQRAGELAQRLGSLSHFLSAAPELLDIIHHLSSEILLRHSRKVGSNLILLSLAHRWLTDNPASKIVTLVEVDTAFLRPESDPRCLRAAA
jgi:hypothetical protein